MVRWVAVLTVAALLAVIVVPWAHAQAPLPPLTQYIQDFDTLANSGTSSTVPTGWAFSETGANANTVYTAGTGSSNTGDTYSFGASGSTERAFGGLRSGNLIPTIGVQFQNNTGGTIGQLSIRYNCEQWRIGVTNRGAADRLDFQYSTDATSLTTGTWIDVDALDCLSTVTSGAAGALDGNANRTVVSSAITGLNIANGASFWLRWNDFDIASSDDGLAVDDYVMDEANPNTITLRTATGRSGLGMGLVAGVVGLGAVGAAVALRRKTYQPPTIVHDAKLEAQAGSPLGENPLDGLDHLVK